MRVLIKTLVVLIVLLVLAGAGFRSAAFLRESVYRFSEPARGGSFVTTEMGEVYVREFGPVEGPPVLLIHGSVVWSKLWDDTSEALAQAGFRAISFDMPPMGYSQLDPEHNYDRVTQSARIASLARAMEIKPHLVAHSFGAGAAVEAVLREQEVFESLVIVNGALGLDADPEKTLPFVLRPLWVREVAISLTVTNPYAMKPMLRSFLYQKDTATAEVVDLLREPFRVIDATEGLAHWLPSLLVPPKGALSSDRAQYSKITLPSGIIWGREDQATPLAQGQELNALIPDSQLIVLDEIGHIPQIEDPISFQRALLAVLGSF